MSWHPANAPEPSTPSCEALEAIIVPRPRNLGGFQVRRVLPSAQRQMVGPFVFFDQMGPTALMPGAGIDSGPKGRLEGWAICSGARGCGVHTASSMIPQTRHCTPLFPQKHNDRRAHRHAVKIMRGKLVLTVA